MLCCVSGSPAVAQNSMIPPGCAGKTGEALRECVRDATPEEQIEQITPIKPAPDPAQPINCQRMLFADQSFCASRNEVILECRKNRHSDFEGCFNQYAANIPLPTAANCARVDAKSRPRCVHRNAVYLKCAANRLRYFMCLEAPDAEK